MEIIGTIIGNIVTHACNCCADGTSHLCELKQNVRALQSSMKELKDRRDDMMVKMISEESDPFLPGIRTHEVSGWLESIEALEERVERLLQEEGIKNKRNYFCCWGPNSCYTGSKLGKSVLRLLNAAKELLSRGKFEKVTNECKQIPVQEMPMGEVQGMDPLIDKVSTFLTTEGNHLNILGVYGMGGVGKTTLLMKVNNEFLKRFHDFDVVIWAVVSQDQDIKNIQNQIGKYLRLSWPEETNLRERASDIFKMLRNKKFLLLLDDIWDRIDLGSIGIPRIGSSSTSTQAIMKSKIVFTTRSESVCGLMEADKKIKVECLEWGEAWTLFQEKVKQEALNCHPDIPELAQKVAKECLGLPLALITIGRTMASKKTVREWQRALAILQKYAAEFSGMVEEVLVILKFSYDNLQNEKLKSCFLYCSLYPEDYQIDKERLIDQWVGEGFLDEVDDIDEARDEGHDVIGSLVDACLLESVANMEQVVKMHDVIRDLAFWVASGCGKEKGKYLTVQAKKKLKLNEWEKAERIYIIDILNRAPKCSNLSTVLFQPNEAICYMIDDIFQFMPKLKVLDMSYRKMESVPESIRSLSKLQFLNMSHTSSDFYPPEQIYLDWLECLVELKYLILDHSHNLGFLKPGTLVCLTKLQMLDLFGSNSSCNWEAENGPSLDELESLQQLDYLGITIHTGVALRKLVSSQILILRTKRLGIEDFPAGIRCISLSPYISPSESSPLSTVISLTDMSCLKSLSLRNCNEIKELRIAGWVSMEEKATLITTLERLHIQSNERLRIVWNVPHQSVYFANLKHVDISDCPQLKDVTWLINAVNLEELTLTKLDGLVDVISYELALNVIHSFSRLRMLILRNLKNLEKICNNSVKFHCLETITIEKCPQLKKLPFDANSQIPETLKKIAGETEWWTKHEWEDDTAETNFAPYCVEVMYM